MIRDEILKADEQALAQFILERLGWTDNHPYLTSGHWNTNWRNPRGEIEGLPNLLDLDVLYAESDRWAKKNRLRIRDELQMYGGFYCSIYREFGEGEWFVHDAPTRVLARLRAWALALLAMEE